MVEITAPRFLETPEPAWVKCDSHRELPGEEIACAISRIGGDTRIVITSSRYFDVSSDRLSAIVVGSHGQGRLVDFPSGDRVLVPEAVIETANGNPVRS